MSDPTKQVNQKLSLNALSLAVGVVGQTHTYNSEQIIRLFPSDKKVMVIGGIYNSSTPTLSNGQVGSLQFDSSSNLLVAISGSSSFSISGNVAHDAVDSGNPIKIGGKATDPTAMPTAVASGDRVNASFDLYGRLITYNGALNAGEDLTTDVQKVEHRYNYTNLTADGLIKSGSGLIHTIAIAPSTATPTPGLLTVFDNTAGSGAVIYKEWVFATTTGHSILIDAPFGTGCYVEYDGTLANVNVTVSWR